MYKRRNHFVPASYLSLFSTKSTRDGLLWVFDKKNKKKYIQTCENIATKKDYYRVCIDDEPPDYFENELCRIEGIGKSILDNIIETKTLPVDETRNELMHYIALLALRVPKVWDHIARQFEKEHKRIMIMVTKTKTAQDVFNLLSKNGITLNSIEEAEEIRKIVINGDYDLRMDNTYKVKMLVHMIEPLPEMLSHRNWGMVFKTENQSCCFITSDYPVMLYPTKTTDYPFSPGFGLENTEVYFPISKEVALIGSFTKGKNIIRRTKNYMTKKCNDKCIRLAQRFVYSNKEFIDTIGYQDINEYSIVR